MSTLTRVPRTHLLLITSAIIVVAMLFAHVVLLNDDAVDAEGDVAAFIGWSIFAIAVTAVLLLVAVPMIDRKDRRMAVLGFGAGAVVAVVIFWTGLPFALAAAALHAAGPGEEHIPDQGEAPATAGVLLAVLAIIGAFVLCIIG